MMLFVVCVLGVNWTPKPKSGGLRYKRCRSDSGWFCDLFFTSVCFWLPARLFADVLNDVAMFMEILAPHFPACFTLIVCAAGIFKVKTT